MPKTCQRAVVKFQEIDQSAFRGWGATAQRRCKRTAIDKRQFKCTRTVQVQQFVVCGRRPQPRFFFDLAFDFVDPPSKRQRRRAAMFVLCADPRRIHSWLLRNAAGTPLSDRRRPETLITGARTPRASVGSRTSRRRRVAFHLRSCPVIQPPLHNGASLRRTPPVTPYPERLDSSESGATCNAVSRSRRINGVSARFRMRHETLLRTVYCMFQCRGYEICNRIIATVVAFDLRFAAYPKSPSA